VKKVLILVNIWQSCKEEGKKKHQTLHPKLEVNELEAVA